MKRSLFVVCCLSLLVGAMPVASQAPVQSVNPIIGSWKLNVEQSTYSPGPPPLKGTGSVRQYAAGVDGSVVAITFNIDPSGLPSLGAISAANYDGREYAQHTVATLATSLGSHIAPKLERTISYTATNQYTVRIVQKQDGKVVASSTRTISRDGRTFTDRSDFTDAAGARIANVLVFEKQ